MKYEMAAATKNGTEAMIKCESKIIPDKESHFKHGSLLMLRNMQWFVTPNQSLNRSLAGQYWKY